MNDYGPLSLSLFGRGRQTPGLRLAIIIDNNNNRYSRGRPAGGLEPPWAPGSPHFDAAFCLAFRRRCLGVRSILSTGDSVSPRRWDRTCSRNSATQVSICAMFSAILVSRAFLALARLASFLKKTSFSGFRSLSNGHSPPSARTSFRSSAARRAETAGFRPYRPPTGPS